MNDRFLFKKGEKYLVSNYSFVLMIWICCKLLEYIVVSNILNYLDEDNILVDCYYGFRVRKSWEIYMFIFSYDLFENLDLGFKLIWLF